MNLLTSLMTMDRRLPTKDYDAWDMILSIIKSYLP